MAIDITYDSQVIASAEPGQTATLSCANMKMKTDIGVAIPADYIIPSGEVEITEAGQYDVDVTTAKTAKVNVAGAEYNIHYDRDIAPTDTTKLWVQALKPEGISVMAAPEPYGMDTTKTGGAILPVSLTSSTCAAVGNKIYIFGGQLEEEEASVFEKVFNKEIFVFDYTTNEVRTLDTQLPAGGRLSCAAVGDKIYIIGGFYDTSSVAPILIFDTTTEEVTSVTGVCPAANYQTAAIAVGTKVYIVGGQEATYNASTKRTSVVKSSTAIQVFDTETNELTTLNSVLPAAKAALPLGVIDTKLYIFGATDSDNMCILDIENDILEVTGLANTPTSGANSVMIDSKEYTLHSTGVWIYKPKKLAGVNVLVKPKLPGGNKCIAIGSIIYLFGIWNEEAQKYQDIAIYDTRVRVPENHMLIEESHMHRFYITPEIQIGAHTIYYGNAEGIGKKVNGAVYNGAKWVDFISPVITAKHYKQSIKLDEGVSYSGFNCNVGDLVVAYFITTYEVTLSEGWTLLGASENLSSTTTVKAYWAYKFAESTNVKTAIDIGDGRTARSIALLIPGATGVTLSKDFIYKEGTETRGITVDKPEGLVLWGVWLGDDYKYFTCSTKDLPVVSDTVIRIIPDGSDRETVEFYCKGYQDTPIVVSCLTVEGIDKLYDTVFDED